MYKVFGKKQFGQLLLIIGLVGAFFFAFLYDFFISIAVYFIAISLFIKSIYLIIIAFNIPSTNLKIYSFTQGGLYLVFSALIFSMPDKQQFLSILVGSLIILTLLSKLLITTNRLEQIKIDSLKYFLAVIIICMGLGGVGKIIVVALCSIVAIAGLLIMIFGSSNNKFADFNDYSNDKPDDVIDTTGNTRDE